MTRVVKTAINGGRVAPAYHWSSDLQAYSSSCKEVVNWIPTIERACTRRYGSQIEFALDPVFSDVPGFTAKHIDFQYGQTDFDTVILHTDSRGIPQEDPNNYPVAISIRNRNGNQVKTFLSPDVPYNAGQLDDLETFQSFDALYIFSADHPTLKLIRNSELDWTLEDHVYNGGPWKLGNDDRTKIIRADVPEWDVATTYALGDVVFTGSTLLTSGTSSNVFYGTEWTGVGRGTNRNKLYYTRVDVIPTGIAVGDKITVSGAVPSGTKNLDGVWVVARVDATNNWIDLVTGTKEVGGGPTLVNDYSNNDMSSAQLFLVGQKQTYHVSKQSGNTGNNPTTQPSDFWTAEQYISGQLTLTASSDVWEATDVDRVYRIAPNQSSKISGTFLDTDAGEFSDAVPAFGLVTITTEGGVWDGELVLQLSADDGGSWDDIAAISSEDGNRNATVSRTITDFGALIRVYMKERTTATGDTGCKYYVTLDDPQFSYFVITEYISPTEVRAFTQAPIGAIPSNWRWNEGVFGGAEGYPSTAEVLDDTLIVSGVPGSPGTVYFSQLGDWTTWTPGGFTGAAFEVVIGKSTRNVVQWIRSKESLLVGTDAGEWTIAPRDRNNVLGLTNYAIERQGEYGSSSVPAVTMGDFVTYVEAGGYRIRSLEGSIYDRGTFRSTDISYQVPDYFINNTVKQMAYTRSPHPVLWILMEDSRLFTWTFDSTNKVAAWAEQKLAGTTSIYSISTAPTTAGDAVLLTTNIGGTPTVQSISYGVETLDCARVYTNVDQRTLYYYEGQVDNPEIYDSAYILNTASVYMKDNSTVHTPVSIIQLFSPETDIRVFDGTTQLSDGVDYMHINGSNELYISILGTFADIKVFTGTTELVVNVNYQIVAGINMLYIELTGEYSQGWPQLTISDLSGPLSSSDYVIQSNNNTVLIPNKSIDEIVITYDLLAYTLTRGYEYNAVFLGQAFAFTGVALPPDEFSVGRSDRVLVGYQQENMIWPLDLMGDFQLGGPGGTMSYNEVDLLVTDSLGLEVRDPRLGYGDNEGWYSMLDLTPTDLLGQTLSLYTGVQRMDFSSDVQYGGVDIQIRANGPRSSTISSMAVNVERVK